MEIVSREEAHKSGLTHYYTGKGCKRGHLSKRFVSTGGCVECQNWQRLPAMSAPNTGMPPTPYMFSMGTVKSPEMISYVHSRVLAQVDRYAAEFWAREEAHRDQIHPDDPSFHARAVLRAWEAERAAHDERLRAQGWTDEQLAEARRYV